MPFLCLMHQTIRKHSVWRKKSRATKTYKTDKHTQSNTLYILLIIFITDLLVAALSWPWITYWRRCLSFPLQAAAGKLSEDGLLQMSSSELQDTMRRLGSNLDDRSRLTTALSCLKSANETGEQDLTLRNCIKYIRPFLKITRNYTDFFQDSVLICLTAMLVLH